MRTYPTPQEVQRAVAGKSKAPKIRFRKGTVKTTEYIYVDKDGNAWHKVTQLEGIDDATGERVKVFYQSRLKKGKWVKGKPDSTVPYNLPKVLQAKTVFIVEGEKTADYLNRTLDLAGITTAAVTTSPMGALNGHLWKDFVRRYPDIAKKKIRILPDNDKPGTKYVQTVVAIILEVNPQADVKIVTLPDLPESGDFVDWLANFKAENEDKNDEELERLAIKGLVELCKQAESVTPDTVKMWQQSNTDGEPPKRWLPFPLETLPSGLRHFVIAVSQSIGIDAAKTAASALSILSGIIGRTFEIEIKQGYREYAMLWVALVADSAGGKSPALKHIRKPIDRLQADAARHYKLQMEMFIADSEKYKQSKKSKKNSENNDCPKLVVPPVKPVLRRFIVGDCTVEVLVPLVSDNPHGLCMIRDELAAFFGGMDKYNKGKKGDMQSYIEIHGGMLTPVDRIGRGSIVAETPSLSIIGGIQSPVIRERIKCESEFLTTGFGARFLMTYSQKHPILWNDNVVDSAAEKSYEELIGKLLSYRKVYAANRPGIVTLTPEAKALIVDFQHQQAYESLDVSDAGMDTFLNKAAIHAARICLNLHVVKCAENDIDPATEPVSAETMQQAIALTEWFLNETYRLYAMFAGEAVDGELTVDQRKVMTLLRSRNDPMTANEMRGASRPVQKIENLESVLQSLIDAGLIQKGHRQHESKGRPAIEYKIASQ